MSAGKIVGKLARKMLLCLGTGAAGLAGTAATQMLLSKLTKSGDPDELPLTDQDISATTDDDSVVETTLEDGVEVETE